MNREQLRTLNWWAAIAFWAMALAAWNTPWDLRFYERPVAERRAVEWEHRFVGFMLMINGTLCWIAYCIAAPATSHEPHPAPKPSEPPPHNPAPPRKRIALD